MCCLFSSGTSSPLPPVYLLFNDLLFSLSIFNTSIILSPLYTITSPIHFYASPFSFLCLLPVVWLSTFTILFPPLFTVTIPFLPPVTYFLYIFPHACTACHIHLHMFKVNCHHYTIWKQGIWT